MEYVEDSDDKKTLPKGIEDLVRPLISGAKANLESRGEVMPVAFVRPAVGPMMVIGFRFQNDEEKAKFAWKIRQTCIQTVADMVVTIMEMYYLKVENMEDWRKSGSKRPSECVDERKEGVFIGIETIDGNWMAIAPILQGEKFKTFNENVEFSEASGSEGIFVNLLGKLKSF